MTNEEALRLIKATESCFVVWSTATSEIVAVKPLRREASSDDRLSALTTMSRECDGPTRGRFLESAAVSMGTLLKEQADIAYTAARQRMRWAWRADHTDNLLLLLETGVFPPPMSAQDDAKLIIDEIYYARVAELSPQQVARLDAVAAKSFFSPLGAAAASKLECWLAVIQKDRRRLERFWQVRLAKQGYRVFSRNFAIAAGDLAVDRDDVIEHFVAAVEHAGLFDPRFMAMLALGKIGAAAGDRAADAISAHIYDSSEGVRKLRGQVLSRIRTPSRDWTSCGSCVKGMVPAADGPRFKTCSLCLGLGHVQIDAAQPAVAADCA